MLTRSSRRKLAVPSAFALMAALSLGLTTAPVQAERSVGVTLGAPTTFSNAQTAVQKPMRTATSKKKKKKKNKRRGSYSS